MNKEKIMNLVGELSIQATNADNYFEIEDITEQIEEELHSKPVMPKVFDEWFSSKKNVSKIKRLIEMCRLGGGGSPEQHDLYNWLHDFDGKPGCKWNVNEDKYRMCFDAIENDYEVEK